MVHRFISMHVYYVEIADYAQSMLPNMKKQIYNFYKEMLPKKKVWLQYVKSKTETVNKDLVEDIAKYYEVGATDALSYIAVMTKEEIPIILGEMGKDEKEIKETIKMSRLEELLYSAEEHGRRQQMFEEIKKVRTEDPKLSLEQQYEQAYQNVMKT